MITSLIPTLHWQYQGYHQQDLTTTRTMRHLPFIYRDSQDPGQQDIAVSECSIIAHRGGLVTISSQLPVHLEILNAREQNGRRVRVELQRRCST